MLRIKHILNYGFSSIMLLTISFQSTVIIANDIVPTEGLAGNASVFVFRGSQKRPQERAGASSRFGGTKAHRERVNAQIAAKRNKKADQAKARKAQLAKARLRERNAKLKLSNTLTARAETQMEAGDIDTAATNFREALKANPKNTDAGLGLSEALTAKGIEAAGDNYNESAIAYLDEAVKYNNRNETAFTKLGEIHAARDRYSQAATNYEKALAVDPQLSSLYMPIGLAYAQAGDAVKADLYLAKAESSGTDTADARFARGIILYRQGKNAEALTYFDRIIAAAPQNAGAYYHRGVVYDRLKESDKSIASFKQSIRFDPANALAWFDLGVIYYNNGDYNNALTAYKETIKIDNANAKAHANLASTYRQLERYPEANAEYKIAAETIKDDADLYSEWGFCLGKTNEWDKAAARLETARSLSPSAIDDTNAGWAYYNQALIDKQNKKEAEAAKNLASAKASHQKAVQKDPKLDAAYMNLGSTQNSLGEHDDAVVSLNKANSLHSDWPIALNQLGLAYRGTDNLPLALAQFNRVVTLDGNHIMGLFNLGSTQYATGDKKGAKKTQERLKKLNPTMAERLGNVIAGRLIDEGIRRIRNNIRIPGIPF